MDFIQAVTSVVSVAAGLTAVLVALTQLTAATRLRRWTEHLRGELEAKQLSEYERGIALSLHREAMARLIALHALPAGLLVLPGLLAAIPLLLFWFAGWSVARGHPGFRTAEAALASESPMGVLLLISLLVFGLLILTMSLVVSISVMLDRRYIERDYFRGVTVERNVSFCGRSTSLLSFLGWRAVAAAFALAAGSVLVTAGLGVASGFPADPPNAVLLNSMLVGSVVFGMPLTIYGFRRLGLAREWRHEPLPLPERLEPSPMSPLGRVLHWSTARPRAHQ